MTRRSSSWMTAAVIVCLCAGTGLRAQVPGGTDAARKQNLAARISAAASLVRDDPHTAVRMLEALDKEYPGDTQVLTLLGDAHQVLGNVDSAIGAYSRCLAVNPGDARAGSSLGTLYIQKGDRARGDTVFRDLITQTGRSVNTYRSIGATLSAAGFQDLALQMYDQGRRETKDNYILTVDIAQIRRNMGDIEGSLREYLYLIESSPKHFSIARDRILDLARDPRVNNEAFFAQMNDAAAKSSQRELVLNALALAYLEKGMFENALEVALEADQIQPSTGKVLFTLADRTVAEYRRQTTADRAKYFDMALRALDAFVRNHPNASEIPRAKLMFVDLLVDLSAGRVEKRPGPELETATTQAIETLDWMIRSFPGTDHAEQAYLKKGDIVFRIKKQPQEAAQIYKEGMSKSRFRPTVFAERLGRLYLVTRDYANAGAYYGRLVNDREPELHEAGIYYTGLLLGIQGQYEAARDTLTALAQANPSSRFTNDAIGLAWVIEEGLQGEQKVLARYMGAIESEVAEDTTSALAALGEITTRPADTPLRSRALFKEGELYQGGGRFDDAVKSFETFVRDYPTDTRVPDAERRIAEVYEYGYGDAKRALEKYEDILLSHPYYIYLDEVREDVTRLRDKAGAPRGSS